MAKKGTRRAKKGGGIGDYFKGLWNKIIGKPTPTTDYAQTSTQTSPQNPNPYANPNANPQYPPAMGGKKRRARSMKGGVTGHTETGVASRAFKIGGRTRKQRKNRRH